MKIEFVTLFPSMVLDATQHSILARAAEAGAVEFRAHNPRDHSTDNHKTVDEKPFGGAPGMLLRCQEMNACLNAAQIQSTDAVVFFEPSGQLFRQSVARELSTHDRILLVCGHYEGIDQRMIDRWGTHVLSLGDFILTGGELPALVVADAVVRLLPGSLGDSASLDEDSHSDGLLSYPQYTRHQDFEGLAVPDVLVSGDHQAIARWRRTQQLRTTRANRPDLFCTAPLSLADLELL
jgi:tRNA (guanine37-N1)-methyltransferase